MTWQIEKDESNASRRVIEFRTFKSDGTSPDTGSSNSSLRMSIGGNVQFTPNALVSAISANAAMYFLTLNQSDVSALGNHSLWYEGAFSQHVASIQVVGYNPMSRTSAFTSADSVGLKAVTHSGATVRGVENYSNLSGTLSNLTVQVSGGTIAGVTNKVDLRAGVYSDISVRLDASAIPAGAFQADAIDATAFAAMNLSDVTVRIQGMNYSGLTIQGVANYSNLSGTLSNLTVQATNVDLSTAAYGIISDTTLTEPSAVPAWPMRQRAGLAWMVALSSNSLSQDSTLQTLRNRADNASIGTAPTSSSSTLFVRGSFT